MKIGILLTGTVAVAVLCAGTAYAVESQSDILDRAMKLAAAGQGAGATNAAAATETSLRPVRCYARYAELTAAELQPRDFLREFLRRQADGLTGNRMKMGYPFDSCLFLGSITNVHFTEGVYHGTDMAINDPTWWPYEQAAYQLDGMIRVGQLVGRKDLTDEVKANIDWFVSHPDENGTLGRRYGFAALNDCEWPFVVFSRAVMAYLELHPEDERVIAAMERHYASLREMLAKSGGRVRLAYEGALKFAERTGDSRFVDDFVANLSKDWNLSTNRILKSFCRVWNHGVSHSEDVKLPALAYLYTGDETWLKAGKRLVERTFYYNEQPSGQISANEFMSGHDPRQGFETCVAADMLWALGYYLQADGDCAIADRMERIAYNALPGALKKDFTGLQYLSAVNQVACTPFANNSQFNFAESAWRQYRVDHFPQCCCGNVSRAMPAFVRRMWMKDAKTGAPTALLYGPSEVKGDGWRIEEETDYPFGDRIVLKVHVEGKGAAEFPITFRVPGWTQVAEASVAVNGRPANLALKAGTLAQIAREWREGDTLELNFPAAIALESDRNWHWIRRGALTFSYAVESDVVEEEPGNRFGALNILPKGAWNYAFDLSKLDVSKLKLERRESDYPLATPSLAIRVPVAEIREWQTLDQERFTPDVPLYVHPTGRSAEIELVPYATTLSRITAFPDTVRREPLHVVAAYASPTCYDWKWGDLDDAKYTNPEDSWTDMDFRTKGSIPQRTPDQFFDLDGHYHEKTPAHCGSMKYAYLTFRFWSDEDTEATLALGMSWFGIAKMDGEVIYKTEGWEQTQTWAPHWIRHRVKKGYNYVFCKIGWPGHWPQWRREWGAKLEVFK